MRFLILAIVCLAIGCKPPVVDFNGKYIQSIERDVITVEGGHTLELNGEPGSKIIYLVRHAEKDTMPPNNPILTEAGYERSYKLAEMFKKSRLDAVYSTLYNRTVHTVDSLTTVKGIETKIYQPRDLKQLSIDIVESKEMNRVLVAGHSNTTPALANVFMEEKIIEAGFHDDDYDNFLVVNILPDGTKELHQLRFK